MDTKKEIERRYLNMFLHALDDLPNGTITSTERPDFLIHAPNRVIGIEVTRIFDSGDRVTPSQDAERDLIVERAQVIAGERAIAPVMVEVFFDSKHSTGKRDRDMIAQHLVDEIAANIPIVDGHRTNRNFYGKNGLQFPRQISAVSIWRFTALKSHNWQSANAGIVYETFTPLLQQLIDKKNDKVTAYRLKCDECILLVVADWRGPSAFFEISEQMLGETYQTTFDAIYFMEGYSGRITKLTILNLTNFNRSV